MQCSVRIPRYEVSYAVFSEVGVLRNIEVSSNVEKVTSWRLLSGQAKQKNRTFHMVCVDILQPHPRGQTSWFPVFTSWNEVCPKEFLPDFGAKEAFHGSRLF